MFANETFMGLMESGPPPLVEGRKPPKPPGPGSGLPAADGEMKVLSFMRPYILARHVVPGVTLIMGGSPADYALVKDVIKLKRGRIRVVIDRGGGRTQTAPFRATQKLGYLAPVEESVEAIGESVDEGGEPLEERLTRDDYLPPDLQGTDPNHYDAEGLKIWWWERDGKIIGTAFAGRQQKPVWHSFFKSRSEFEAKATQTIDNNKASRAIKAKKNAARTAGSKLAKVGDILVSSWGYNQTNVSFYQVIETRGKATVIVQKVEKEVVSSVRGAEYVVARPNRFIRRETPIRKRVAPARDGYEIKISSSEYARLWDGKKLYQTPIGGGH